MSWENPKTNWGQSGQTVPGAGDFNRIEGNIQHLQDTKETPAGAQAKAEAAAGAVQAELNTHKAEMATEEAVGHIQLATNEEVIAGDDAAKAVTPAGLKARLSTALKPYINTSDAVLLGGYLEPVVVVESPNSGYTVPNSQRHWININNNSRIRQNGIIHQVKVFVHNLTAVTSYYFAIWRKNAAGTYDRIYQEDIISKITTLPGVNTVNLSQPVPVQEGDYIGYGIVTGAGTPIGQHYVYPQSASISSKYVSGEAPAASNYDWSSKTTGTSLNPFQVLGTPPDIVIIGSSEIAGHSANYSYIEDSNTENQASQISYWIEKITGLTCQNMGTGAQTTTQMAARFTKDCINLKPRIAIIKANDNDLASVTQEQFLANMTAMIEACITAGITPVVGKLSPSTDLSNELSLVKDQFNAALETLVNSYPEAILFDYSPIVGVFRSGGSVGNYWDINPIYNSGDNVHLNALGYFKAAAAIAEKI
jgi:lysophospholipase L1-like esterase